MLIYFFIFFFTADGGTQVTEQPVYDWNCVSEDIFRQATFGKEIVNFDKKKTTQCEKRCGDHKDCTSCLKGTGGEGGWSECRWSTQLNEVKSSKKIYFLLFILLFNIVITISKLIIFQLININLFLN